MNPQNLLSLLCLTGLLATGCSTPYQIKNLARENQRATDHMARVHEGDLRALGAYDQARVAQFNSFLGDYFALREDVARAFNDALDRSKKATLAELDHEFDEHAEKLLTVDFWIAFREEASKDLNGVLFKDREQARAKTAAADAYPTDSEALNQSLLATRKVYAGAALKYDAVEKSFAELARKIRRERDAYRLENEKRLAAILPLKAKEGAKGFTLPSNAAEVARRIDELSPAYQTLNKAQGALSRYLDENNPSVDFLEGVVNGLAGESKKVSESAGTNSLSAIPAEPAGGALPGLGGLFDGMRDIAASIGGAKSTGLEALGPVLQKVMDTFRPVIKTEVPDGDKDKTK